MENLIGKTIEHAGASWTVTSCTPIEKEYENIIRVCKETNKHPAYFGVSKVLKNGKLSDKQKMVVMFFESGSFIVL